MNTNNKTMAVDVLAAIDNALHGDSRARGAARCDLREARAAVAELIEYTSLLVAQLVLHGDMDDGCFYYNGRSASELQTPMADVSAALARVKGEAA